MSSGDNSGVFGALVGLSDIRKFSTDSPEIWGAERNLLSSLLPASQDY